MKNTRSFLTKGIGFLFLAVTIANVSQANGDTSGNKELKAQVNCISITEDNVIFRIAYLNEEGKKFTLKITDAEGEVLYIDSFKEKNFRKKVQAPKNVADKWNFEISNGTQVFKQSFSLEHKLVEQVVALN